MKQLLLSVFFISTYLLSLGQSDTYTWKKQTTITYPGKQDDICFINENIGFVGTMTSGYQTTDGGKTWTKTDIGRATNKIRVYDDKDTYHLHAIGVNVYQLEVKKVEMK